MPYTEQDLLNVETRKKLIEQFDSEGNQRRKHDAFKAYECLKDKTSHYVLELLLRQFNQATVQEMQYAISNVSILRKVMDKLAKVYANGVKRTMPGSKPGEDSPDTDAIEKVAEHLKLNAAMAKANRYLRAMKNTKVYVHPIQCEDKNDIEVEILPMFHYDVVPLAHNPKEPLAVVISDYVAKRPTLYALGDAGKRTNTRQMVRPEDESEKLMGDNDEMVAESAVPPPLVRSFSSTDSASKSKHEDNRRFVWWTPNFHFTTDVKGVILPPAPGTEQDLSNPISELPFVNLCGEQDGQYWAEGGSDLVDAGVKINTMITHLRHVAITQGYGQLYMTGKNLPKSVQVGPNTCIQLPQEDAGEPEPKMGFMNADAPLAEIQGIIEMDVALMLTTNNLSTSGVSTSLKGGTKDVASGISMLIDRSESNEDISDQQRVFIAKEPKVWSKIQLWHEVLNGNGSLSPEWLTLSLPEKPETVQLSFPASEPVMSEMDELAIIEKRQALGLNTRVELLMRDNPALTEEEAAERLALIDKEHAQRAADAAKAMGDNGGNQNQEGGGVGKPNDLNAGANGGA